MEISLENLYVDLGGFKGKNQGENVYLKKSKKHGRQTL